MALLLLQIGDCGLQIWVEEMPYTLMRHTLVIFTHKSAIANLPAGRAVCNLQSK